MHSQSFLLEAPGLPPTPPTPIKLIIKGRPTLGKHLLSVSYLYWPVFQKFCFLFECLACVAVFWVVRGSESWQTDANYFERNSKFRFFLLDQCQPPCVLEPKEVDF